MKTKIKIIILCLSLILTISLMSDTYSRYVADTTGSVDVHFAKWKILVSNSDVTNSNVSRVEITPVINKSENIAENKLAPTSEGYFDLEIDPTKNDTSFYYELSLNVITEDFHDLIISKYSLIKNEDFESGKITVDEIKDNKISGTVIYKEVPTGEDGYFLEPFTIRIYFEWNDAEGSTMSDEADTLMAQNNEYLKIEALIKFKQVMENEIEELIASPSE